jgi:hypothetical protein
MVKIAIALAGCIGQAQALGMRLSELPRGRRGPTSPRRPCKHGEYQGDVRGRRDDQQWLATSARPAWTCCRSRTLEPFRPGQRAVVFDHRVRARSGACTVRSAYQGPAEYEAAIYDQADYQAA